MLFPNGGCYLSWLKKKKKKKSKLTSFLYALLKKKIGDKQSLSTFNMEDSRMIFATRPKFEEGLLAELNYSPIEKTYLALFFIVDKLKHYMQAYTLLLIAKADLIKYILSRLVVSGTRKTKNF